MRDSQKAPGTWSHLFDLERLPSGAEGAVVHGWTSERTPVARVRVNADVRLSNVTVDAEPLSLSAVKAANSPDATQERKSARGAGWITDPEQRKAVEERAMEVAHAWYLVRGYEVWARGKPFDLLCTRGPRHGGGASEVRHVEVKGMQGPPESVVLTRNEVHDAQKPNGWVSDLFVVSEIRLERLALGGWIGVGGKEWRIPNWSPLDSDLTATEYSYRLPK